jgi:NADH:ubiquinone oxidoreductase subunit
MTIGTLLSTWLTKNYVGADEFGNKYYISKAKDAEGKFRRTVIYNGKAEPSKVPPVWHAWLHYLTDEFPSASKKYKWQKEHQPNLTGTKNAHKPNGHPLNENRKDLTKYYDAWQPK